MVRPCSAWSLVHIVPNKREILVMPIEWHKIATLVRQKTYDIESSAMWKKLSYRVSTIPEQLKQEHKSYSTGFKQTYTNNIMGNLLHGSLIPSGMDKTMGQEESQPSMQLGDKESKKWFVWLSAGRPCPLPSVLEWQAFINARDTDGLISNVHYTSAAEASTIGCTHWLLYPSEIKTEWAGRHQTQAKAFNLLQAIQCLCFTPSA